MNPRDVNAGFPSASGYAPYDDPNAALWASITPPSDPTLSTKVRRRVGAFSPDALAHRLRQIFPGIFPSHNIAFSAVLAAAMTLGATVGLLGFALADALKSESSAIAAAPSSPTRAASTDTSHVQRETPSLRPAATDTSERAGAAAPSSPASQTLTTLTPRPALDDVDSPAPPRAKRQHARSKVTKKKARRAHLSKKRAGSRRDTRPRTRNEKARALARALGS